MFSQIDEKTAEIRRLKNEMKNAENNSDYKTLLSKYENESKKWKTEIGNYQSKIDILTADTGRLVANKDELETQLRLVELNSENLNAQLQDAKSKENDLKKIIDEMRSTGKIATNFFQLFSIKFQLIDFGLID